MEFLSFMEEAGVFDAGFSGPSFTWSNNRRGRAQIWKRLDRLILNEECLGVASAISIVHLARHPSDHSPLKISFASRRDNKPRLFRFLNVWTTRPDLMEVIRQAWNMEVQGSPFRILCSKLLAARKGIQGWSKQSFGNIFDAVKEAKGGLLRAEGAMVHEDSEGAQVELNKAHAELRRALVVEEQHWRQKARVTWLRSGDRNSKYFHAVVKQRRVQGMIHRVKRTNGVWVEDNDGIATEAIEYFSNLFAGDTSSNLDGLLGLIPSLIMGEDNMILEEVPTLEEVRRVVFAMDGESAAGPDGFTGKFFTFVWDIIAQDVHKAIVSFFCDAEFPRFITSTSIVLIPKDPNPQDFSKFRPIMHLLLAAVLPASVFKLLEKVCANFLWDASDDEMKYHWIGWSHLCYPVEEGGVSLRRLRDIYKAFSCKLWWQFRAGSSLWVRFMLAKYCRDLHQCQVQLSRCASGTWRKMLNISSYGDPCSLVQRFHYEWEMEYPSIIASPPLDLLPSVLLHSVPRGGRADELIWSLTSSGKFTLALAFEEVRQARNSLFVHSQIWHRRIPSKISVFILRLLCGRLPFPDVLCRMGFQMPSKCLCCPNGAIETVEHVFSEGQIAKAVWNYFASMCGLTQLYDWSGQQGGGIRVEIARWRAKETGCLTLNTDGCSKGNPRWSGGGGVLRDSLGRPIVAFSAFFGKRLSLHAEALALLTGLQLCVERGFANVEIQSNSQEFIATGEVGTPEALICAACWCHTRFRQIVEFQVPIPAPLPPHENPEIQIPAEPVVELQFAEDAPNSPPPVEESFEKDQM
ncbi:uncharacterized protein [Coffea arabica]|uniref:RNase H type-1 domain-containing protein n=1 Tax=Coffea arabica TaxID=13443 RepID=A0ABM4WQ01_COFAR